MMKNRSIFRYTLLLALCCLLENARAQNLAFKPEPPDSIVTLDVYLPFHQGISRVKAAVYGEYAVMDGDIVLGKLADLRRQQQPPVSERGLVCDICPLWPDNTIYYQIEPGDFSPAYETMIHDAAAYVSDNTNLCVEQRNNEPDYLRIVAASGCWSYVGMNGGAQQLGLNDITDGYGCSFGSIVHEFSHAAGLWHEQSREDRDEHVIIHWANIDPAYVHNFNQHIADGLDVGPYNSWSIMHYGPYAFSQNGKPTITRHDCSTNLGSTGQYTPGDIDAVGFLYPLPCECSSSNIAANFGEADRVLWSRLSRFISRELRGNYKILERAYIRHQHEVDRALRSEDPKHRGLNAAFATLKTRLKQTFIQAFILEKETTFSADDLAVWKHFLHELGKAVDSEDFQKDMQKVSRLFDAAAGKDLKSGLIAFDRASLEEISAVNTKSPVQRLSAALLGNPGVVTILRYELPFAGDVEVGLFDSGGALRRRLRSGFEESGIYTLEIDKQELPPDIYFIRCVLNGASGQQQSIQKLIVHR